MHSSNDLLGGAGATPLLGEVAPRMVVFGASGFVGSMVATLAGLSGIKVSAVRGRNIEDADIAEGDVVVNCAIHPLYRGQAYDRAYDLERLTAERAADSGARVIMLSSRKVYSEKARWGALETSEAQGDNTAYGQNKARTERHVIDSLGSDACILRLSNVFGFEYAPETMRPSFFGMMLYRLKLRGEIVLDVAGSTRRDFIPAERVAAAILSIVRSWRGGVFNLGCGQPISCGAIAEEVIAGYGGGNLICGDSVRDEFYLDTTKWAEVFGTPTTPEDIFLAARRQGELLRSA